MSAAEGERPRYPWALGAQESLILHKLKGLAHAYFLEMGIEDNSTRWANEEGELW